MKCPDLYWSAIAHGAIQLTYPLKVLYITEGTKDRGYPLLRLWLF